MTSHKIHERASLTKNISKELESDINEEMLEETSFLEEVEDKSEETLEKKTSEDSSSSILTETLSPWRAAAYLHVQTCRTKYIKECGKDIHLHSDDSDTMIQLKERITPSCAQVADKERLRMKHKKVSKSIPAAFDAWLQNKNKELKHRKMEENKQREINELREAAEEAKKAKKRADKVEKWRKNRQHLDNEKRALAKIKMRDEAGKQNVTEITANAIPATEWEKIRQAAEDMKYIEPLKLGRLKGQGSKDPGKYLTKYVVQPDPIFRARYKHIIEAEKSRPTEIILDGDHKEGVEDPAGLPKQFQQLLKQEAKKLNEYLTASSPLVEQESDHKLIGESEISQLLEKRIVRRKPKLSIRKPTTKTKKTSSRSRPSITYSGSCLKKYSF